MHVTPICRFHIYLSPPLVSHELNMQRILAYRRTLFESKYFLKFLPDLAIVATELYVMYGQGAVYRHYSVAGHHPRYIYIASVISP